MLNNIKRYFNIIFKRHLLNSVEEYAEFVLNIEQHIKEYKLISRHELLEALTFYGWTEIGSGLYSIVLLTPCKQYVLRIGNTIDKGYTLNAYDAICNPENPHYCNIDMMFFGLNTKHSFTFMEKLQPLHSSSKEVQNLYESSTKSMETFWNNGPSMLVVHGEPLQSTIMKIVEVGKKNFRTLDVHRGNVMVRNERVLVFTDPLS